VRGESGQNTGLDRRGGREGREEPHTGAVGLSVGWQKADHACGF
jgi:hypothetical protein